MTSSLCSCLLLLAVAGAAGSVRVNVALKEKAYPRDTTLPQGAPQKVGLAVDGDKNTASASCATTPEMDYSWWGVHLTNKTCVGYVNITTSADPAQALFHFTVGLQSGRSALYQHDPHPGGYTVCANYTGGPVPPGTTIRLECVGGGVEGRDLVIQSHGLKSTLTLCEVEVYNSTRCHPEVVTTHNPLEVATTARQSSATTLHASYFKTSLAVASSIIFVLSSLSSLY